jgi:glycosyltransferase involved in cell wall biosynthesis
LGLVLAFPLSLFVHYYFDPVQRLEFGFRPLKTLSTYAVLFGYAYGWFRGKPSTPTTTYLGRKRAEVDEEEVEYGSQPDNLRAHTRDHNSSANGKGYGAIGAPRKSEGATLNTNMQMPHPRVSIIIPSWTGKIDKVFKSIEEQTFTDYEVEVVKGVSPAGRARNIGASRTGGEILLFIDDDAYLGARDTLEKLVRALDQSPEVGVAGTSKLVPKSASRLQKAIAQQVPRMVYPVVPSTVESNPPLHKYGYTALTTTCCAVRREAFDAAQGFDEELTRSGEDTDFFYRIRRDNWKLMVVGNCWVYHDPPASIGDLVRKSFWYGTGHALEARKHPQRGMAIIPLNKWYGKVVLLGLVLAFPLSLFVHYYFDPVQRLEFGFRPLKTLSTYAVLFGYAYGWFRGKPSTPTTTYLGRKRAVGTEDA